MITGTSTGYGESSLGPDGLQIALKHAAEKAQVDGTSIQVLCGGAAVDCALLREPTRIRDGYAATLVGDVLGFRYDNEGNRVATVAIGPTTEEGRFRKFLSVIVQPPIPGGRSRTGSGKRIINPNDNASDHTSYRY